MSGGSYNYLYEACDLEDLQNRQHDLRDMADRLAALGYAQDAATETEELLALFRQWQIRAGVRIRRLENVWKAIEWWDSADWSEHRVHEALAEYRSDAISPSAREALPHSEPS
ncbi:hypothetical protein KEF29_03140 [Streptomyces tuirus]|uniref:Uncharacterized protein n=1 Tax=Streptomyces tuirus TaxID=68278 RepID=A0A941F8V9_9ACTN|nr:hypothetical protein [Streptomyces tuirus]